MGTDLNIVLRVKELKHEASECLSIVFEKPQGLTFKAGDWLDIRFPVPEFPVGRTYSFASAPTESDLMITFTKGVSPFKKALEKVQPGETMLITQYGSNGFLLDRRSPAVFIAGGIGIAPFRSMIKEQIDSHRPLAITLLFSNHRNDFPFRAELEAWQHTSPSFKTIFVVTSEEGRLTSKKIQMELERSGIEHFTTPRYYIAGSPQMVQNCEHHLFALRIEKNRIKTDSFEGY
ncbi:FAD-dependent oxidoreductase [Ktedonobacter robiniae]|uniref:Flavodoxin n=1 Tax=Ktedonobacter robiniae TaxID=2778365 RepID=A0ABQ3V827_9CHLR|nr:FAD-dependent oxidoreductase [Ktedonobacter robiniae]GHO60785.1 flavodoxin [Ktedonobacter robiniae]